MFYEKVNRFRGVVCDGKKLSNDVDMSLVEKESYEYYKSALETGEHIAYLVYDNETFIGAGGVSFYQVMPTYHNPTGKKAYIMNVYTAPGYRRQGIAFHTLDLLVKDAKEQDMLQIALEASSVRINSNIVLSMEGLELCNMQEN